MDDQLTRVERLERLVAIQTETLTKARELASLQQVTIIGLANLCGVTQEDLERAARRVSKATGAN